MATGTPASHVNRWAGADHAIRIGAYEPVVVL
jgi:hypothetical protein